ncbi:MAG: hypothetical protein NUV76_00120 [Candidatus Kuenenia sp.]|nr:hypothetical protein [Candidatus Kuenenia sp.]
MRATSYEELLNAISTKSEVTNKVIRAVYPANSFFRIAKCSFVLIRGCISMLRKLEKMDVYCNVCDTFCRNDLVVSLKRLVEAGDLLISLQNKVKFPHFIIRIEDYYLGKLEDKIENYMIAADPEIRELVKALGGKINKRNALQ